jgi:hypothetical protein
MTPFAGWENFYVIVGSSAGALIGLQFVVVTLIADIPVAGANLQGGHTYATPTVVHFGAVLLLAGIMTAPWPGVHPATIFWGFMGFTGAVYSVIVLRRMRRHQYQPEFEDWLFHAILPFTAYAALATSAFTIAFHRQIALFTNGASAMLLLFIGIHNAWDAITYHVFVQRKKQMDKASGGQHPE